MNIVSASRRTDIPAFYAQWFMDGLKRGAIEFIHPYSGQRLNVSLKPNDVIAFVFWSKNFCGFIDHLEWIRKDYACVFHYTINEYPLEIEGNIPLLTRRLDSFKKISDMFSPDNIIWRYDPILLTKNFNMDYHLAKFTEISGILKGYTKKCYTSFVQLYGKNKVILRNSGVDENESQNTIKLDLISKLKGICESNTMELLNCCYPLLKEAGVPSGSCIDKKLIEKITGLNLKEIKKAPTRKSCGCYKSIDIGTYSTCKGKCLYCYAR